MSDNVLQLGNLSNLNKINSDLDEIIFLNELNQVISERPFHPEAFLKAIDYYLEVNNLDKAKIYINLLLKLTPKWEIPLKLSIGNIETNLDHDNISRYSLIKAAFKLNDFQYRDQNISVCISRFSHNYKKNGYM